MTKARVKTLNDYIRSLPEYYDWKLLILFRDLFTCKRCKVLGKMKSDPLGTGPILNVDHHPVSLNKIVKKYKITSIEEAVLCEKLWNIENGRTLCERCHYKTKSYGRYKV